MDAYYENKVSLGLIFKPEINFEWQDLTNKQRWAYVNQDQITELKFRQFLKVINPGGYEEGSQQEYVHYGNDDQLENTQIEILALRAEILPGSSNFKQYEDSLLSAIDSKKPLAMQGLMDWQSRTRWPYSNVISLTLKEYSRAELTEMQNKILWLNDDIYGPGLSLKEIAKKENLNYAAVKQHKSRAKKRLKDLGIKKFKYYPWTDEVLCHTWLILPSWERILIGTTTYIIQHEKKVSGTWTYRRISSQRFIQHNLRDYLIEFWKWGVTFSAIVIEGGVNNTKTTKRINNGKKDNKYCNETGNKERVKSYSLGFAKTIQHDWGPN